MAPLLSVITVAHQSATVIRRALDSVPSGCQIICVDNASDDELDSVLAGLDFIFVRNRVNTGFGTACNQGARAATGTFLLFMNPDVVLAAGAVDHMLAAVSRYPEANVFIPRVSDQNGRHLFRENSRLQPAGRGSFIKGATIAGDCCSKFVDGAIFMIRRSLFHELGGFDENMFMYFEDDDLSLRLIESREPIIFVSDARATHYLGTSTARTASNLVYREFHKKQSGLYFREKYRIGYRRNIDFMHQISNLAFYALTVNKTKFFGTIGRVRAIWMAGFRGGSSSEHRGNNSWARRHGGRYQRSNQ